MRLRVLLRPAVALGAVAIGGAPGAGASGYAHMYPTVWKAGTENLQVRIEGGDCGSYDLGMVDRLQLKDWYSSESAFYGYEPALVEPHVEDEGDEKLWEGPVQVQSSAVDGKHEIDVYCQENDQKIGEFDVKIIEGKPPKKPKKCGAGKVLEKGKCVPRGPVKIPNPNPH